MKKLKKPKLDVERELADELREALILVMRTTRDPYEFVNQAYEEAKKVVRAMKYSHPDERH